KFWVSGKPSSVPTALPRWLCWARGRGHPDWRVPPRAATVIARVQVGAPALEPQVQCPWPQPWPTARGVDSAPDYFRLDHPAPRLRARTGTGLRASLVALALSLRDPKSAPSTPHSRQPRPPRRA